jgi:hypothetical protein
MPKPLNQQSGMPQMTAAFMGWTIALDLLRITQSVVEGFVQEVESLTRIMGIWQPLSPEEIELKPEGQRAWEWIDLHVQGKTFNFKVNDRIKRDDIPYKVMAVKDYRLNNYVEYHLIRDYDYIQPPEPLPVPNYVYDGEDAVYDGLDRVIDGFQ